MLRQAVRPNAAKRAPGRFVTLPAPVAGLNFRDSIASLKPNEALILDNYFPEASFIRLRRGYQAHVTGFAAPVETLMEYASPTARALFAASGTAIYNATTAGAVGASVLGSLTNARFQHVMFSTSAGDYLGCVNGADGFITYDGAAWATQAITVATPTDFVDVTLWKSRLWFTANGSNKVWYLGSGAVSGAATALDLGPVFRLGGAVAFIVPLSFNSGYAVDDGLVFVSTEGECALYVGTDPSSAATFRLQGVFRIPAPLSGRRGYTRFNGDCLVLTEAGLVSLLVSMRLDNTQQSNSSVSDKIDQELMRQALAERSTFGWTVFAYPASAALMINAPQGSDVFHQWTMNTITTAWCRYKNQNALCWSLLENAPFFGGQTAVYQADFGQQDDSAVIEGAVKGSFSTMGGGVLKRVTMIRPFLTTNAPLNPALGVDLDFANTAPTDVGATPVVVAALWDTALWDDAHWGGGNYVSREWSAALGIGTYVSPRMSTATRGLEITLNAFDLVVEPAAASAL